ncbi:hypothetical protein ACOMHN_037525 [Nucella lapillus]
MHKKYPPYHPTYILDWVPVGGRLKLISANASGVWGLGQEGQVYYRTGTYENNQSIGERWWQVEGKLSHLSVGWNIVWGVDEWGKVWYREGMDPQHVTGVSWVNVPTDISFRQITVNRVGSVWAIDLKNDVYFRVGACIDQKAGLFWRKVDYLRLLQLNASWCGVWAVDVYGSVHCRMGTDSGFEGSHWEQVGANTPMMNNVSCGGHGMTLGVTSWGQVVLREGMCNQQPQGSHWRPLNGQLNMVDIYGHSVWGVTPDLDPVNATCWPYPYPPSRSLREPID